MEIKNLKKTANCLLKAILNKEKIILYADSDLDGIASAVILKEAIEELGGKSLFFYFPDRQKEGYGLNKKALKYLAKFQPALFLALDLGIGNFEEVEFAKKLGFKVIIIDHHEVLPPLPKAIIVNPKQKTDTYPFKNLTTTGIVYKLTKILFSQAQKNWQPEKFLELVALATIFDRMPLIEENEKLVEEGILALNYTKRVGLKVLMKLTKFKSGEIEEIRQKIILPLNSGGLKDHLNETFLFLIENSEKKAENLAKILIKRHRKNKEEIRKISKKVESQISDFKNPIIFEGGSFLPIIFLGPVATRICQKYKKPTFIFSKEKKEATGACRMPLDINGIEAMKNCSQYLKNFGGHPPAAGFRIKNENLEKFKKCLIEYFSNLCAN
jgi:single-stranded-DNA-specific exonuclease